jgi:uncharacterized protein (TIGR00369 family)
MQKLLNPFRELPGYSCFGCSPDNKEGLRMEFYDDGEFITSEWDPRLSFSGYLDILHGGIQATMLDEIASWVVMTRVKSSGVTSRLNVRYLKQVNIKDGPVSLKAKLEKYQHKIAIIHAQLFNAQGELAAEAEVSYYIFPEEVAREKLNYPGVEKFYKP